MTDPIDPLSSRPRRPVLAWVAIVLAVVALVVAFRHDAPSTSDPATARAVQTRMQRINQTGTIRVGYGGFPPYTIIDPKQTDATQRVTGFSVDLVNEIAARHLPAYKVEWQQFSWDTMKGDLAADRFDFIADPVFQTVTRAADFAFVEPYSYFGIAVALVRIDDDRFKRFADLDREGITIALAEGWTSSEYARAALHKPTFKSIPVTGDAFTQLDEVLVGRADVALNDVPTVLQYVKAHPGKVKGLWLTDPPSSVAGGFLLRQGDPDLKDFLDTSIRVLRADGTLDRLDAKWQSLGFFPHLRLEPGAGLKSGTLPAAP